MLEELFQAWRTDIAAGRQSLMIAADHATVAELNQRARADRITTGQVTAAGVPTAHGAVVGVGDVVVTRRNDRRLSTGAGWVKNGDTWTVTATTPDGSLTVTRSSHHRTSGAQVTLPPKCVQEHVDLGYATTAHGAQGRTVDTAHAYITTTTRREVLYVAATRGRESNHLYVDTSFEPDADTAHQPAVPKEPQDVLRQVLATPGVDVSATQTLTSATATGTSSPHSPGSPPTKQHTSITRLRGSAGRVARRRGSRTRPHRHRVGTRRSHPLADADDIAAVLHERLDRRFAGTRPQLPLARGHIVGLIQVVNSTADRDLQQALLERQTLIERRTRQLSHEAIRDRQPWTTHLGSLPTDPVRREPWLRHIDTITAYRQRWTITDSTPLGGERTVTPEHETQRHLADRAALLARDVQGGVSRSDPPQRNMTRSFAP